MDGALAGPSLLARTQSESSWLLLRNLFLPTPRSILFLAAWMGQYLRVSSLTTEGLWVRHMSMSDANEVAEWRYEGPWSVYDGDGTPPDTAGYWAVVDDDGQFVGYYCTGLEARVPGLAGQPGTLDLGVGMHPDLVGAGHGREFAKAVMTHCRQTHEEEFVRAVVKSWNERSLRLAAAMGFEVAGTHARVQGGQTVTYTVLLAPLHPRVSAG